MGQLNIVLIDDSPVNVQILMKALADDYRVIPFTIPAEGIAFLKSNPKVDMVLLDIDMPEQNGYEMFRIIKTLPKLAKVPIIFVTARTDVESEISAFDLGIVDYIKKPIIPVIAKKRIEYHINASQREQNIIEESLIIKKLTEVTVKMLVALVDKFNDKSEAHINRIMAYVTILSEALREQGIYQEQLTPEFVEHLRLSAPFHDCGKIYISDKILMKPTKLTDAEFREVQRHTILGAELMKRAREMMATPSFYDMAEKLVLHYHERWDGQGYPANMKEQEIPLCARIMAFADVYDALTHKRPYKEPYSHDKAVEIIMSEKGKAFDPVICDVFAQKAGAFQKILNKYV